MEAIAEIHEECPICLSRMEAEDRGGVAWLACPNGCPTEFEAPALPVESAAAKSAVA